MYGKILSKRSNQSELGRHGRFHTYFKKELKTDLKKCKTGLRNSTQNGSIKAQRHGRSKNNFDTKNKNKRNVDFKTRI